MSNWHRGQDMSKHTATPWHVSHANASRPWTAIGSADFSAAWVGRFTTETDAEHIVRCVNTHAQLLEALQAIYANGGTATNEMLISARAALAAAQGEA